MVVVVNSVEPCRIMTLYMTFTSLSGHSKWRKGSSDMKLDVLDMSRSAGSGISFLGFTCRMDDIGS